MIFSLLMDCAIKTCFDGVYHFLIKLCKQNVATSIPPSYFFLVIVMYISLYIVWYNIHTSDDTAKHYQNVDCFIAFISFTHGNQLNIILFNSRWLVTSWDIDQVHVALLHPSILLWACWKHHSCGTQCL